MTLLHDDLAEYDPNFCLLSHLWKLKSPPTYEHVTQRLMHTVT